MNDVEKLLAIEEIRRLKAKYFWGLDHRDWDLWRREVFAADAFLDVPEADLVVTGIEKIIAWVASATGDQVSVHHGHNPNIEITSNATATGVWAWRYGSIGPRSIRSPTAAPISTGSVTITRPTSADLRGGVSSPRA